MAKIFTEEFKKKTDPVVACYETKRASILEVLHMIQEDHGFIHEEAEKEVAEYLGIPAIDVREVMTFYTLYYNKPKAKTRFCVCRNLSCSLLGGEQMLKYLEEKLGIKAGQMTRDGKYSIETVECLGACEHAPMLQLNDDEYVKFLTKEKIDKLVDRDSGDGSRACPPERECRRE